jgi:hypothetical protein
LLHSSGTVVLRRDGRGFGGWVSTDERASRRDYWRFNEIARSGLTTDAT